MESTVVSLPLMMALAYAALMFGGAALVHRHRHYLHGSIWRTFAYTLALAVYCTSWTYFGAVGSAATSGWDYLPIYLGPMLLMTFGGGFLHRLNQEVHRDGATSIADFIGSRFGKSRSVAALVTIIALFGTIPYIALQLRSVVLSFALVSGTPESSGLLLGAAAVLALFAIIFGAWRYQIVGENEAILFAVAFESIVKLVAMFLVAGLAFWLFRTVPEAQVVAGMDRFRAGFDWGRLDMDFAVTTALSALTILCLPRNFFVCVMEARDPGDILRARWGFIVYLLLTVLAVLPIAAAGSAMLPGTTRPDLYVLSLPQHFGFSNLALFIFLGGLSAAVAMIVTETVAVSSMISNDLFAPLLLRRSMGDGHMGERLLWIRRSAIIALVAAAVIYALWTPSTTQLASVGLVAFVAIAQCGPALILAVYRPHNDAVAARAGLVTGFVLWLVLLFLPAINGASLNHDTHWLPLPGFGQINSFTYGTILSLGGNVAAYLLLSARKVRRADLVGRFIGQRGIPPIATVGALRDLVVRFVGEEATREAFGSDAERTMPVDRASARGAERLIGSVVGASSARAIMASAMSGQGVGLADVAQLLDASGQSLHFSQGLLAATLENIDVGVSVIDRDLRLIAWNSRYLELFHYPSGLVRVGVPVAELIRCNAERGDCGPGEVEDHVARRLGHMRTRHQHSFERHRADGRVIKTVGGPMPDGGYVMSFTDITLEARARTATENARRDLERAVEDRTTELSEANRKLAIAIADKTRFLAAASHDLLQPLHAALLFSAALRRRLDDEQARSMLSRLDRSIEAANDLLRALLDISKLDAGGIRASPSRFSVRAALVDLVDNFQPLAAEKGLRLVVGPGDGWVEVDRTLLRSIMQNFLSNAIRYTERGGVLVAARRRGALLRLEVYDTGVGIPPNKIDAVFREFERLGHSGEAGIGLGLAIVERSAPLVGGRIDVRSVPGRGSRFALVLPSAPALAKGNEEVPLLPMSHAPAPRQLLVVDDDATNRLAMQSVLRELGHGCVVAGSVTAALDVAGPLDGALVDYHLGDGQNGIAVIEALRFARPGLAVALVTAERDQAVLDDARQRGIAVLAKPLGLAVLDQWIADMGEGTVKASAPPP